MAKITDPARHGKSDDELKTRFPGGIVLSDGTTAYPGYHVGDLVTPGFMEVLESHMHMSESTWHKIISDDPLGWKEFCK